MVPPLIQQKDLNKVIATENPRSIYLLFEGTNTEVSLVHPLCSNSAFFRNCQIIFKPLDKSGKTKGVTDPRGLIKEAKKYIQDHKEFNSGRDKMLIFFDLDVLKNDQAKMNRLISMKTNDIILCFTNPAIELFILLFKPHSFETIIKPHEKEIVGNGYVETSKGNKERYIYNLVKKEMGLDTKSSSADFRPVLDNIEIAIQQENMFLNHLLSKAANKLSSNIAYVLKKIKEGNIDDISY